MFNVMFEKRFGFFNQNISKSEALSEEKLIEKLWAALFALGRGLCMTR